MSAILNIKPIVSEARLSDRIYRNLKQAITEMNVYAKDAELRLDERELSVRLAASRTPIREALVRLEQEGLVRVVPRKGVYIVRKTKAELLEIIRVWAALESMAARLVTHRASDKEIASLGKLFATFKGGQIQAQIDEYSETNIKFHQTIIDLSKSPLIKEIADGLLIHVRSIRQRTISEADRANRSIVDHMHIIDALEKRDSDLAERLVREHTLNLLAHVERNVELD